MKRILVILVSCLMLIVLSGCRQTEGGSIEVFQLEEKEKKLLQKVGTHPHEVMRFNYNNIPIEYKYIRVWVEYYEKEELVTDNLLGVRWQVEDEEQIICSFRSNKDNLIVTINGSSSTSSEINTVDSIWTTIANEQKIQVIDDRAFILGIRVINKGVSFEPFSDAAFVENDLSNVLKNDYVYVIKGAFEKE
ncbi:hypothetical protein [Vallitalea okinawensis]|uniref:hypothetical protein n=1 Tax=Vallitalea okinawensis TaxID=2078660 RepID=UPI000CFD3485|nr:hypothetical protein [Vallitalea okinawensis]